MCQTKPNQTKPLGWYRSVHDSGFLWLLPCCLSTVPASGQRPRLRVGDNLQDHRRSAHQVVRTAGHDLRHTPGVGPATPTREFGTSVCPCACCRSWVVGCCGGSFWPGTVDAEQAKARWHGRHAHPTSETISGCCCTQALPTSRQLPSDTAPPAWASRPARGHEVKRVAIPASDGEKHSLLRGALAVCPAPCARRLWRCCRLTGARCPRSRQHARPEDCAENRDHTARHAASHDSETGRAGGVPDVSLTHSPSPLITSMEARLQRRMPLRCDIAPDNSSVGTNLTALYLPYAATSNSGGCSRARAWM